MVIGDNRSYLVALLGLDPDMVEPFGRARGWPTTAAALSEHEGFRDYLQARIEADVNSRLSRFETVKRFDVLPHDFTVEGGELTSTMKIKRAFVQHKHRVRIDAMYAHAVSDAAA
jgi:long-chain acyl-CoA synthetase